MVSENPTPESAAHNIPVFTVSELSQALKLTIEETFQQVRVRGEISGFKRAASGHLYFTLKDEGAVLEAVVWRGAVLRLGLKPEDGIEVIATGRLTTYPGRSKYQIVVERLELAGEGALLKLLEERRKKLAAEGLFDAQRKKPLPFLPEVIGVVTSPTGAVIRDILHRLNDRFPRRVLLWPVLVQGEGAAEQVAAAIAGFNRLEAGGPVPRPDVLIVARGGGSLEDLWAFNEEIVVRAAAASRIPLIAAVGHETDTTLIDFAADVRAPTPTAAAEMAVPVRLELLAQVMDLTARLTGTMQRFLEDRAVRLRDLARALPKLPRLIEEQAQRLDDWSERLKNSLRVGFQNRRARLAELAARLVSPRQQIRHAESQLKAEARALKTAVQARLKDAAARFAQAQALLESVSYRSVLARGYAVVRDAKDRPLTSAAKISAGMALALEFHDGRAAAVATEGPGGEPARDKPARSGRRDDRQGKLL
jgi:exodeoxyribonuclease VII large subunit